MIIDGMRATDRTVALVLAFYAAFNRRDWAGVLATLSEDVRHDVNQGGRESGRAAFQALLDRHGKQFAERLEPLAEQLDECVKFDLRRDPGPQPNEPRHQRTAGQQHAARITKITAE